jgi:hypothetical protein
MATMNEEWSATLPSEVSRDGRKYRARVLGFARAANTWEGRIEFRDESGQVLTTDHETSQPNQKALEYWSTGLEPVYLDGALKRAIELSARKPRTMR